MVLCGVLISTRAEVGDNSWTSLFVEIYIRVPVPLTQSDHQYQSVLEVDKLLTHFKVSTP